MLRELRAGDGPALLRLLATEFPEENRILGLRPDGVEKVIRRLFRWDARLLIGLLRLVGRSPFALYVIADGRRVVASTLLSLTPATGYLSMVVVDPAYRGRGYARRLIEMARAASARRRRGFVALDVLEQNAPARRLYETSGYRTLRTTAFLACDAVAAAAPPAPLPAIRPFRPADATALAAIAHELAPPEVDRVLPVLAQSLRGSGWVDRMLENASAAWVVDRGRGPEAHVAAVSSPATDAAHLSTPIIGPEVDAATAAALLGVAHRWIAERSAVRAVTMVPEYLPRVRSALEAAGYREAIRVLTLYRAAA